MADVHQLHRFVEAQASIYSTARAELAAGRKRSHWMWFIFPQIEGLGSSPTAQRYAISNLEEAAAYLAHPVLGPRLKECTALVNAVEGRTVHEIFGYPDDLKFHSCVTLFARAVGEDNPLFEESLTKYFGGREDEGTLRVLRALL